MWECGICMTWNDPHRDKCWGCGSKKEDAIAWTPHKPDNDYEE